MWKCEQCLVGYLQLVVLFTNTFYPAGASTLVQTITLRNAKILQIDGSSIYIASQSYIWRLLPVPILTQVDQMVKEREYEGALALMESLTDFDETLKVTIIGKPY